MRPGSPSTGRPKPGYQLAQALTNGTVSHAAIERAVAERT